MTTNYDDITDDYLKAVHHPIKKHCESFTLLHVLGNVQAKSLLDLACGDGYNTRLVKQNGTSQTVGVDISQKMIERARQTEMTTSQGITYQIGDITKLGRIGQFDRVTAVFLFPYAATKQELAAMFQTIYVNLKPNGKLVSLTIDPDLQEEDLVNFERYGVTFAAKAGLQDGTMITTTIDIAGGNSFTLQTYYWKKTTYENIIYAIGFRGIRWYPIQISEAGIEEYGAAYWQAYAKKPYAMVLECEK